MMLNVLSESSAHQDGANKQIRCRKTVMESANKNKQQIHEASYIYFILILLYTIRCEASAIYFDVVTFVHL